MEMEKEPDNKAMFKALSVVGLPQFKLDAYGYPLAGQVVKRYREQMKYTDKDGRIRNWTQADLAKRLGVTELMVRLMETKNKGLDSIERRRVLAALLNIPPALLGLASLDTVIQTLSQSSVKSPAIMSKAVDNTNIITLYQSTLTAYNKLYTKGASQGLIDEVETITTQIKHDIEHTSDKIQKKKLLLLLWEFNWLVNLFYTYDSQDWPGLSKKVNESLQVARELNDVNLYALSLNQSCNARILQQNGNLARVEIDAAISHLRNANDLVKSIVYAQAAKAYALDTTDLGNVTSARQYIAQSQKILANMSSGDERYIPVRVNSPMCLFTQFDGYRIMNRFSEALSVVDEIEDASHPDNARDLALLNLNRARCYIALKRPEYDKALDLIEDALSVFKRAGSSHNMREIIKVWKRISSSPHGNAPEVVDLGMRLKQK